MTSPAPPAPPYDETTGLSIRDLEVGYGTGTVIKGVSFDLPEGTATLLTGRNGVGKSTLLKAIMGFLPIAAGHVQWQGHPLLDATQPTATKDTRSIAQLGFGYVPEDRRVFQELTVAANLVTGEKQGPGHRWSQADILTLLPPLKPLLNRRAGLLSGGEQQMLSVARSLMGAPSILLLDEPSEGLAPVILDSMAEALKHLVSTAKNAQETPLTLLITEQNWQFAKSFTNRVLVLDQGLLVHDATLNDFAQDQSAQQQWLGVHF
ncbi:MAG: ATP-binding cassette domain-containing protein [Pseudomonadota bacterium]